MAIAYDNSAVISGSSGSFTVGAITNGILLAFTYSTNDTVTAATYNGVSMTSIGKTTFLGGGRYGIQAFYLINPTTGANTLAFTGIVGGGFAVSYSGAKQTAQPDSFAVNAATSVSTISGTTTTVANNAWTVMAEVDSASTTRTGGTGTTARLNDNATLGGALFDSNAPITPAGSTSLISNMGVSATSAVIIVSIAPVAAAATGRPNRLALLGIG